MGNCIEIVQLNENKIFNSHGEMLSKRNFIIIEIRKDGRLKKVELELGKTYNLENVIKELSEI